MSLRLAMLLTAAAALLGGCAQSHLDEMAADLSAIGQPSATAGASMPAVDVIYDKAADTSADPAVPIKAAAWGETNVQPGADKVSGWGSLSVDTAP
ncbi:MAG: hypothetical protein WC829_14500, partial [Hyphomicrobium sp.]